MRRTAWLVVAAAVLAASGVWAQGPGGGGPGPGPGGPGGGRRQPGPKRQLTSFVVALGEMEKRGKCALKPDKAQAALAIIRPLQKKPKMTDEDAKAALRSLKAVLTTRQLNEIGKINKEMRAKAEARMRQWFQRNAGGQGGMRPGPGGPGMGGPGRPGAGSSDRARMRDRNPFTAPKTDRMPAEGAQFVQANHKRLQDAVALLEKKAKQK